MAEGEFREGRAREGRRENGWLQTLVVIAALGAFMFTLNSQIAEVRGTVGELRERMTAVEVELRGIDGRLDGVETRLAGVEVQLARIEGAVGVPSEANPCAGADALAPVKDSTRLLT